MDDIIKLAARRNRSGNKDSIRIAIDFCRNEYETVKDFCDRHNVSASKLAKLLLLRYIEGKQK